MTDPMLGLVTVGPLCRGDMGGGLVGVMTLRMGTRRCNPIQDVRVEMRFVFVLLSKQSYLFIYTQSARCVGFI